MTRFAPSPTGYLHLGHVANAIYVWGIARAHGGQIVLRMEDHDRGRCRAEYEAAILDDLEWLGLKPDLGSISEFRSGRSRYRQSDNGTRYEAALERLGNAYQVYACDCSRKDISGALEVADREVSYLGRCRDRNLSRGTGVGLRVAIDPGIEQFNDLILGPQQQEPSVQCGDVLIKDRLGNWTYHFAVTVDDFEQGINLVVRGEDLLGSTGRQIRLSRLLGRGEPPVFVHHPLICHGSGQKLSKANKDTGVRDMRAAGMRPAEVLGRAAQLSGLRESPRDLHAEDLANLFRTT